MSEPGERATVLIVEDEKPSARLYAELLEDEYEVRVAHTADGAFEELDDAVDVMLLDRRLPDHPGDEVLEEIEAAGYDPRVVMVTAVDPGFDVIDMGFDDYLVKPLDPDDLRETVERLLRLNEYHEKYVELSSKIVTRDILVFEKRPEELEDSEEFEQLEARIGKLEAELEELEGDLDERLLPT